MSANGRFSAGASQTAMYYAGYLQDDFRLNGKLTLNYGLRWETTSPFTERHNQIKAAIKDAAGMKA